jgi:hypothetical protein
MTSIRTIACLAGIAAILAGCGDTMPSAATPTQAPAEAGASATGVRHPGTAAAPVVGRVLGAEIRARDAEEVRDAILRALTDRYAKDKGITATEAEREAYVASVRKALEQDPTVAATLGPESTEDHAARLEAADAFIRQWKLNGALHQQYGGRIIYQQGGPEPLDAYRTFLEERQAAGDFTIDDAALAEAFWRYYRDDTMHEFVAAGSAAEAKAFSVAPWQAGE